MLRNLWVVLLGLILASPAAAQPRLPARAAEIVTILHGLHPDLAAGADDQRRALTRKIIEQIVCEFPSQGWSWKAADINRPPSKDAFAQTEGGRLWAWDWQDGTTRLPNTYPGKQADHDITGQYPIPVDCVDHLGAPAPTDLEIAELHAEFDAFRKEVRARWAEDDTMYNLLAAQGERTYLSLEEHRKEARRTRNQVLSWLGNWKNLATVAGGILAGVMGSR